MLEWTGERFLPWIDNPQLAYEHLHRYAFASGLAHGQRVLDLASGEGYGANLLARFAEFVVGVDVDEPTVEHARAKYTAPNLKFLTGSITNLPIGEDQSFDLAVCFEAIEHIEDHLALMSEVRRILKNDGTLIISTPNKTTYSEPVERANPFHVKELSLEEFRTLLLQYFSHVTIFGQNVHVASNIWRLEEIDDDCSELSIVRKADSFEFATAIARVPVYFLAVASNSAEGNPALNSVMVDASNSLLHEKDLVIADLLAGKQSQENAIAWIQDKLQHKNAECGQLESERVRLDGKLVRLAGDRAQLAASLEETRQRIASIESSRSWRLLSYMGKLRGLFRGGQTPDR